MNAQQLGGLRRTGDAYRPVRAVRVTGWRTAARPVRTGDAYRPVRAVRVTGWRTAARPVRTGDAYRPVRAVRVTGWRRVARPVRRRLSVGAVVVAVFLGAAVLLVGPSASPAHACSCSAGSDDQHFEGAEAVFRGQLVSYTPPPPPVMSSTDPAIWTFAVSEVYKGDVAPTQPVISSVDGASCGLEIPHQGEFFVFASRRDIIGNDSAASTTPTCVAAPARRPPGRWPSPPSSRRPPSPPPPPPPTTQAPPATTITTVTTVATVVITEPGADHDRHSPVPRHHRTAVPRRETGVGHGPDRRGPVGRHPRGTGGGRCRRRPVRPRWGRRPPPPTPTGRHPLELPAGGGRRWGHRDGG